MNGGPAQDDPAKGRFLVLQTMRLSGIALLVLGLLVINQAIELPVIAGYVLVIIGLIDALIAPSLLSRKWKSPLP